MALFGVIVAGRMVQTEFTMLKEGEFVIELPNAGRINHIVVFLTGLQALPVDLGASIFVNWPTMQTDEAASWDYLGYVCNEKPSAVFRVAQFDKSQKNNNSLFVGANTTNSNIGPNAVLGIMLEPLSQIGSRVESEKALPNEQLTMVEFVEKMLTNFVNYMHSFAVSMPVPDQMETRVAEYVPAKAVTDWYANFKRRLQVNPQFWKALS